MSPLAVYIFDVDRRETLRRRESNWFVGTRTKALEKQIKKWRREKKELLINSINPHWSDLWSKIQYW
jgi:predicted GIY-YIG superfamily endonuclease